MSKLTKAELLTKLKSGQALTNEETDILCADDPVFQEAKRRLAAMAGREAARRYMELTTPGTSPDGSVSRRPVGASASQNAADGRGPACREALPCHTGRRRQWRN
ncbi:MAG: hypothetical protein LBH28_03030 [Oscillospiraceae bacterium]|nr:hypothetical protein [Oscillospiraceae bacterium]